MKHLFARLLIMLTALVVLGDGRARADMISFSYQWTTLPQTVLQGEAGSTGTVAISAAQAGTGSATLGDSGGTFIPAATVLTSSSASNPADSFATNFSMKLNLTDTTDPAHHLSGVLNFTGTLSGNLTATTSGLSGTFNTPTQMLTLGTHVYTVAIDALFKPQPPGSSALVKIYADVSVANASSSTGTGGTGSGGVEPSGGNGSPSSTPEPSSLLLGATALAGFALRRLARR